VTTRFSCSIRRATWQRGTSEHDASGYAAAEIVGQHFSKFYPVDDVRQGKCEYELEVAAREGRFEDEGWRIRKDGTRFWANLVISSVRNSQNDLLGFAKVTRDLTERKKAQEEQAGYGQQHDRERSLRSGFSAHLVKPVDVQQLLALVSSEP
jgi:PAS domain S-box-containing protein